MVDYPTLKNPPISEAIIEIRFSETIEDFDRISEGLLKKLEDSYPQKKELKSVEVKYALNTEELSLPVKDKLGYRLESQDGKSILQLKKDGIVLSNIRNYDRWDTFSDEFKKIWILFRKQMSSPISISRLGVRFINKFTLAAKHEDYYRGWLILKTDPAEIKRSSLAYFLEEGDSKSIVKIAASEDNNGKFEMELDIDVFCEKAIDDADIDKSLSDLRNFKNKLFFENINPEIIEEFN